MLGIDLQQVKKIWNLITQVGAEGSQDSLYIKRSNEFSMYNILSALGFAFFTVNVHLPQLFWSSVLISASFVLPILMNLLGLTLFSRFFQIFLFSVVVWTHSGLLGSGSGMHVAFFPAVALIFLIFDYRNMFRIASASLIPVGFLVHLHLYNFQVFGITPLIINSTDITNLSLYVTLMSALMIPLLIRTILQNEMKAHEALTVERTALQHNAKLSEIGSHVAGIAHEINNCISLIDLSCNYLGRPNIDEDRKKNQIQVIANVAKRMKKIANNLRKYSRLNDVRDFEWSTVQELADNAKVLMDFKAINHEVNIYLEVENNLHIYGVIHELEQVLVNLLSNGIDAAKNATKNANEKWVKVVGTTSADEIMIQVIDCGEGIPEHIRTKIFERFYTTKSSSEGTGLGLSICRDIVMAHSGILKINTDHPHTCFEIRFDTKKFPTTESVPNKKFG